MFLRVWLISGRRPSPRRDERIARQRPCSLSCVHHVAPLACVCVCVPYSVFRRLQSTASPQWVQHRGAISLSVALLCCQQADWSRRAEPPVRGRQSGGTGVWQVSRLFWWCCELIKASVWLVLQWHDNDMNNFLELFAWLNMVCCHSLVAFFLCVGIVWYQSWQIVQYKCVYCVTVTFPVLYFIVLINQKKKMLRNGF